jgi:hypothetical protein
MSTLPELPEYQRPVMFYGKPLTFNPKTHRYAWDGKPVPSVTTIINRLGKGDALVQWAANCAVEHIRQYARSTARAVTETEWEAALAAASKAYAVKRDAAADIGTRVHDYARMILEGKTPPEPLDGPAQKAIEAFWHWVEQHCIRPLAVERRVMSAAGMYAGTTDFYGYIDDRLAVLDFKTGRGVYDEAWWQTSAYVAAIEEELRPAVSPDRWIVHLDKETGACTPHLRHSFADHEYDMAVWRSLLDLDKALRAARKHPQPKRAA